MLKLGLIIFATDMETHTFFLKFHFDILNGCDSVLLWQLKIMIFLIMLSYAYTIWLDCRA